jgi:DNA-binding CsgD family transcriptional regulator
MIVLIILTFSIEWFTILSLGLKILKIKVKFNNIIPTILLGVLISLFIKPFIPALAFFITLIPLIIFLRFYGRTKWIIACWVTFILLLATSIGPMLFINPISSINHDIGSFLFKSKYGLPIMGLIEVLGAVLLLVILNISDISLTPDPTQPLKSIEFIAVYVFLVLCYWCYHLTIDIWKNPMQFSTQSFLKWTLTAAAVVGFYIFKINGQKKDLEYQKKDQEYQQLKESKVDSQELVDFSDKLHKTLNPPDIDTEFPVYVTSLPKMKLSKREKEVLQLIAQGYSNEEIAKTLYLSTGWVANLISQYLSPKIGLSDRKLIVYAVYWVKKNKKSR